MENRESTREQLLKASNLADLVGELLDKYIEGQSSIISESSEDITESNEKLLQEVDVYRSRFAEIVGIDPNVEEWERLAEWVRYLQELKDE